MFSFIASILVLLGAVVSSADTNSYIKLSPSETVVMAGENFSIDVYAYAHVPVNALDISISFLPGAIEILGVDKGQSVLTIWAQEPKIEKNSILFSGGTYRRGFVGEHLIATINVKALSSGKTEFAVEKAQLLAGDGSGTPVKVVEAGENSKKSFIIYSQNEDPSQLSANLDVSISADIDGDGKVTLRDVSSFMSAWYSGDRKFDFNNDKKMNFIDFSIILARSFFTTLN